MINSGFVEKSSFWKCLEFLMKLKEKESLNFVLKSLDIEEFELEEYIKFLNSVQYDIKIMTEGSSKKLIPPDNEVKIKVEFSILEWLQFQAHFPYISKAKPKAFHDGLARKLSSVEEEYSDYDLFNGASVLENALNRKQNNIVQLQESSDQQVVTQLEEAIINHSLISAQMINRTLILFPRKIVFCDNSLALIAEAVGDGSLSYVCVNEISRVEIEESNWTPIYSSFEVDDFISSIRLISENSIRLVLKIHSQENFEAKLPYQFFENPYLVTNKEGQLIWAATIEPSDDIYAWVFQLGADIEILDPVQFKKGFLEFCERKLKSVA